MSWSQFKDEVSEKMKACSWKSSDEFAAFFTKKYDEAMKRGKDLTTANPVLKGNTELMQQLMSNAGYVGLASKSESFYSQYMGIIGHAVVGYWTGATLQKTNVPILPAVGTILNLTITSNEVTDPGKFENTQTPPIRNVDNFINAFVMMAKLHHTTIKGTCYTISQYIPPMPIGPAIINWTGYELQSGKDTKGSAILPEDLPEQEEKDDDVLQEGKSVIEHEKNNGRVVYNKSEDAINQGEISGETFYGSKKGTSEGVVANFDEVPPSSGVSSTTAAKPIITPKSRIPLTTINGGPPVPITFTKSEIGRTAPIKGPSLGNQKNGFLNENELVPIAQNGSTRYGGYYRLEKEAAAAFLKWKSQCVKDGFNFTLTSAYRSYEHQTTLGGGSRPTIAKPGCSPHGNALAVDIGELYQMVGGSGDPATNTKAKANSRLYQYLAATGPTFGWYNPIRLADGSGVDECWHWEYWGYYKK